MEKQRPKCAVCAGRAPDVTEAAEEYKGIQEEILWFRYAPSVQTEFRRVLGAIPQACRLTDSKSGIVIELHHCFDEDRLVFQVRGSLPVAKSEKNRFEFFQSDKNRFEFFLRYALRPKENRGRRRKVTIEQILEAIRREPTATLERLAEALDVQVRTLQTCLQNEGLTLKKARVKVIRRKNEEAIVTDNESLPSVEEEYERRFGGDNKITQK